LRFPSIKIREKFLREQAKKGNKLCLLTHIPPYGTGADFHSYNNRFIGSKELMAILEKYPNIFLNVCGHVHKSPIITTRGDTTIINPGTVNTGNYAIVEINDQLEVLGKLHSIYD